MQILSSVSVENKVVLIRADLNVPLNDGKIIDDSRLQAFLPTLRSVLSQNPKRIHILTHLGRPKGQIDLKYSTRTLSVYLLEALEGAKGFDGKIDFRKDFTIGENIVQLHENVRFWPEEKKNPAQMGELLMGLEPDIFVMDAFGTAHRNHGSVTGLSGKIPCVAGLLLEKEVNALAPFAKKDDEKVKGLTILMGGAKMDTKIGILKHFAVTAEHILVGGALANTFLAAEGFDVGESLYQEDKLDTAREVLGLADANKTGFHIPIDVICAENPTDTATVDVPVEDVCGDMKIFDLGPHTINSYLEILAHSKSIIWNGPVGLNEFTLFAHGTERIVRAMEETSADTILGGGDTLSALNQFDANTSKFTHISTGGGAMLTFLEGGDMPGLEVVGFEVE